MDHANRSSIVVFPIHSHLYGFGFDVVADRIIKYGKHAGGVYLNTRATYSLNGRIYSHYQVRKEAVDIQGVIPTKRTRSNYFSWIIALILLFVTLSVTECTTNFTISIQEHQ